MLSDVVPDEDTEGHIVTVDRTRARCLVAEVNVLFTMDELWAVVKLELGYGSNSRQIKDFFQLVVEMTPDERRLLVKLITDWAACERSDCLETAAHNRKEGAGKGNTS
jgi:hypothetical protein